MLRVWAVNVYYLHIFWSACIQGNPYCVYVQLTSIQCKSLKVSVSVSGCVHICSPLYLGPLQINPGLSSFYSCHLKLWPHKTQGLSKETRWWCCRPKCFILLMDNIGFFSALRKNKSYVLFSFWRQWSTWGTLFNQTIPEFSGNLRFFYGVLRHDWRHWGLRLSEPCLQSNCTVLF